MYINKHLFTIILLLFVGSLIVGCQQLDTAGSAAAKEAAPAEVEADMAAHEGAKIGEKNTANVVSLDVNHANSYRTFAPELEKAIARMPQLDPETGVYVEEVKPNLFYVTGGIYQSAFLKTGEGVIVFDAPPSVAQQLPAIIAEHAPDVPITHLVYSHGHRIMSAGPASLARLKA